MSAIRGWNGAAWVAPNWRVGNSSGIPGASGGWVQEYASIPGVVSLDEHFTTPPSDQWRGYYALGILFKPVEWDGASSIYALSEVNVALGQEIEIRSPLLTTKRTSDSTRMARVRFRWRAVNTYAPPGGLTPPTLDVTLAGYRGAWFGERKLSFTGVRDQPLNVDWRTDDSLAFPIVPGEDLRWRASVGLMGQGAFGTYRWQLWVDQAQLIDDATGLPFVDDGYLGWEPRGWDGSRWV
jgi:hypothetical protein